MCMWDGQIIGRLLSFLLSFWMVGTTLRSKGPTRKSSTTSVTSFFLVEGQRLPGCQTEGSWPQVGFIPETWVLSGRVYLVDLSRLPKTNPRSTDGHRVTNLPTSVPRDTTPVLYFSPEDLFLMTWQSVR